jgi:hypothetical protein
MENQMTEQVLNLGADANVEKAFVSKATDPVISPAATTPIDFAAQYPQPLNPEELITMCEEVTAWSVIPEQRTSLQSETWRELNELAFTSGSGYISFADGECPTEYYHDGDNTTVTTKWIGAKKSLTDSDILHSSAVAALGMNGINRLVGGFSNTGLPGVSGQNTIMNEMIANLKAKEIALAGALVLNGWDKMLVTGDVDGNALSFDGIENYVTSGNGARASVVDASGTFDAAKFDRFLAEGCAMPTDLFGHPQAIQEMMSAYFQLGFAGSQVVNVASGNRITPGFNFGSEINTGVGTLRVHADRNFTKTALSASTFQSDIFALRMRHNGQSLIYKLTQMPFAFKDLTPGCTAISFQVSARTALVVKALCAQARHKSIFSGKSVVSCAVI